MKITFLLPCLYLGLISSSFAHNGSAPSSIEHHKLDNVSEHIYVVHGTQKLPSPETRGFMNNPAAILTDEGFIVIDPGSSKEIGRELLTKLSTVSEKPVIAVFNTHVHGDHWLGNHGIREVYPEVPVYAHERMIQRVDSGEGEDWISTFQDMTEGAVEDTRVVGPTVGLQGGEELTLGGIALKIHHTGHAHTDHDLMIEVINDRSLFTGDIVAQNRVPNSDVPHDAHFKGTIGAIQMLLNNDTILYIPGHGISGGREVPEASLQFLEILYDSVTKYYEEGLADYEMKDQVIQDLAAFKGWNNFNEMGRVISFVYQEIERENF
jgi:glyoxylase-like metal-dependent hydrolase (beta-lactamase superfamily II)